jgi:hypothetical protein
MMPTTFGKTSAGIRDTFGTLCILSSHIAADGATGAQTLFARTVPIVSPPPCDIQVASQVRRTGWIAMNSLGIGQGQGLIVVRAAVTIFTTVIGTVHALLDRVKYVEYGLV